LKERAVSNEDFMGLADKIETEPADLRELFVKAITSSLSKSMATEQGKPWTQASENKHQEAIAALVAAARSRGLTEVKMIAVKADGQRVSRSVSVARIGQDRVLQ
jgi:hypothetical protein